MTTFYKTGDTSLMVALSDFWQRLFVDRDLLSAVYQGTHQMLAQAYSELMNEVLSISPQSTPLLDTTRWDVLAFRNDEVVYDLDAQMWRAPLPENFRKIPWLVSGVISPTVVLESGVDYYVEDSALWFVADPFTTAFVGAPTRVIAVTPTVYARRIDAYYTAASTTFSVTGDVFSWYDATPTGETRRLAAPDNTFTPEDVGREVRVGMFDSVIVSVVSDSVAILADVLPALAGPQTFFLRDVQVFIPQHVGQYIYIEQLGTLHKIATYVDEFTVTLDTPVTANGAAVSWRRQGPSQVSECGLWSPVSYLDMYRLQDQFGEILGRASESTEAYRQYILGATSYLTRGPSISRIESALNVIVGLPVVREGGEVVTGLPDSGEVITNRRVYTLPAGARKASLVLGQTLRALDSLTDVFVVTDRGTDPQWWVGERAPTSLMPDASGYRSVASPSPSEIVVGSDRWRVGDPRLIVGADSAGALVTSVSGSNAMRLVPGSVDVVSYDLKEEDVGKTVTIDDVPVTITALAGVAGSASRIRLTLSQDPTWVLPSLITDLRVCRILSCSITGVGPYTVTSASGSAFTAADVGTKIRLSGRPRHFICTGYTSATVIQVTAAFTGDTPLPAGTYQVTVGNADVNVVYSASTNFRDRTESGKHIAVASPENLYEIVSILSDHEILISPTLSAPVLNTFLVTSGFLAVAWELSTRPPLAHQTGYTLWHDYLQKHTYKISYDPAAYDLPYNDIPGELESLIERGKSSYVALITSADTDIEDVAEIEDSLEYVQIDADYAEVFESAPTEVTTSGTRVGTWYGTPRLPIEYIRPNEFGADIELGDTDYAQRVGFRVTFTSSDPADTIVFTVKADVDGTLIVVDADIILTPAMPEYVIDTNGLRLYVTDVMFLGTASDPVLAVDALCDDERLIEYVPGERDAATCAVAAGEVTGPVFIAGDAGRVLSDGANTYVLAEITSSTTAQILYWPSNAAVPDTASIALTWLGHATYATPVVVGGNRSDIETYMATDQFNEWPVLVTADYR